MLIFILKEDMVWKLRTSFTGALLRAESKEVAVLGIEFGVICPASPLFKGLAGIHSSLVCKRGGKGQPLQIFSITFSFHH